MELKTFTGIIINCLNMIKSSFEHNVVVEVCCPLRLAAILVLSSRFSVHVRRCLPPQPVSRNMHLIACWILRRQHCDCSHVFKKICFHWFWSSIFCRVWMVIYQICTLTKTQTNNEDVITSNCIRYYKL